MSSEKVWDEDSLGYGWTGRQKRRLCEQVETSRIEKHVQHAKDCDLSKLIHFQGICGASVLLPQSQEWVELRCRTPDARGHKCSKLAPKKLAGVPS
jgi:hypothetical protein